MSSDSIDYDVDKLDDQLAYHKEMEYIAMKVSDFAKAEHHRKMLEILESIKVRQNQPFKTPEQLSDEDYKVAPTSVDKNKSAE